MYLKLDLLTTVRKLRRATIDSVQVRPGESSGGESSSSGESSSGESSAGEGSSSSGESSSSGKDSSSGGKSGSRGSSGSSGSADIPSGNTTSIGSSASTSSSGGGKQVVIPSGQLFAGRSAGGGTRAEVFGTKEYGSGYPGIASRGVEGRGFPFFFWPLSWGTGGGYGADAAYMHTNEYGDPTNSSRPGGPIGYHAFQSTTANATAFHLIADGATVSALTPSIAAQCSVNLHTTSTTEPPTPFNASALFPEQVVQYYRASSVALTLDGYNNSAVFAAENTTADTSLPGGTDMALLDCLNATIGKGVPLVNGGVNIGPEATLVLSWLWLVAIVARAIGVV
ncbi:hypothetical protein MIND_00178600 [Mycena indigotica]|uniref:Uncharacterized protein n=1 Tax=Mycena indigotica TaxID=2126181 RepID=A0A8H6WEB9_9AGAR|nr:uncharacterized protein MIND_00178600 [Mycena indigotica]KAF7311688.1 hypothetical protein MIND_00178600 [Mycena indigotica]